MPHVEHNGAALYVETTGDPEAPALLLIHAGIANLRMWDPQVEALAREHFVVRFDTRGFGLTETQNVDFSNRADALAVLDSLGVHKATVIGCSRGGTIAIDVALEAPGRIRGLCVIGSGPSGFPELEMTAREDELFDAMDAAYEAKDWDLLLRLEAELWAVGPLRDSADLDPDFVERAYELNRQNLPHVDEAPVVIPLDPPAYERITDVAVPALVMVGEHDMTVALAQYEFLLTTLPAAEGHRFADSAHLPNLEQPEEFETVLLDWLRRNDL